MSKPDLTTSPSLARSLKKGDECRLSSGEPAFEYLDDERLWMAALQYNDEQAGVVTELWVTILSELELAAIPDLLSVQHMEHRELTRDGLLLQEVMLYLAPADQPRIDTRHVWDMEALDAYVDRTRRLLESFTGDDEVSGEVLLLQHDFTGLVTGALEEDALGARERVAEAIGKRGINEDLDAFVSERSESLLRACAEAVTTLDVAAWQHGRSELMALPQRIADTKFPGMAVRTVDAPPVPAALDDMLAFTEIAPMQEWFHTSIRDADQDAFDAVLAKCEALWGALSDFKKSADMRSSQRSILTKAIRRLGDWQKEMPSLFEAVRDAEAQCEAVIKEVSGPLAELSAKRDDILERVASGSELNDEAALQAHWDELADDLKRLLELAGRLRDYLSERDEADVDADMLPAPPELEIAVADFLHPEADSKQAIAGITPATEEHAGALAGLFMASELIDNSEWPDLEAWLNPEDNDQQRDRERYAVLSDSGAVIGLLQSSRTSLMYRPPKGRRVTQDNALVVDRLYLQPDVDAANLPLVVDQLAERLQEVGVKEFYFPIRDFDDTAALEQAQLKALNTAAGRTLAVRRLKRESALPMRRTGRRRRRAVR
jgi:hypothetical protein